MGSIPHQGGERPCAKDQFSSPPTRIGKDLSRVRSEIRQPGRPAAEIPYHVGVMGFPVVPS